MSGHSPIFQQTVVALDLETTGSSPLQAEICEIGAVKWTPDGELVPWQSLVKPRQVMSDFIIGIHGISNEMVASAPRIEEILPEFRAFVGDAYVVGHHSPFDAGFLGVEFERLHITPPRDPIFCTSLLGRKLIKNTPNHKLQTLVKTLGLEKRTAHRALSDALACLDVFMHCLTLIPGEPSLENILSAQGKELHWQDFYLGKLRSLDRLKGVFWGLENQAVIWILYNAQGGKKRKIKPFGIIRNPDGDYIKAQCLIDNREKRFYLDKIVSSEPLD